MALIENKALLLQQNQQFYLMSLAKLQILNYELTLQQGEISQQPLLIPIIFRLDENNLNNGKTKPIFNKVVLNSLRMKPSYALH